MYLHTAIETIQTLIPAYSSLCWIIFILLSLNECKSQKEIKIKKTLLIGYILSAIASLSISIYSFQPENYAYISSLAYLSFLLIHVFYYKLIFLLSTVESKTEFSAWHYFLPTVLCGTFFAYSLFTPLEVQNSLACMRGSSVENYRFYSIQFLYQPGISLIFSLTYSVLTIKRLWNYYSTTEKRKDVIRRPRAWVMLLVFCELTILLAAAIIYLLPLDELTSSKFAIIYILFIVTQHIALGYNIIRRDFLLYIPDSAFEEISEKKEEQTDKLKKNITNNTTQKESYTLHEQVKLNKNELLTIEKLTKKKLDNYLKKEKPYLNPHLKITDLLEPLNINQTQLSGFINKNYGINFKKFINRLRLEELKKIEKIAENRGVEKSELVKKAGFTNYRKYLRSLQIENELDKNRQIETKNESLKKAEDE